MKSENKILSMISFYGCLIMANTSENPIIAWIFVGLSIFYLIKISRIKDEPKN